MECAFTTAPLTTPGAWTDITIYVRSIDISRGRNHELSRSQAGTCSLRLTNTDRRFDPSNTAGPYYPNVIPMRRIRVRAVHNAVTYDLFQGYVENWGQTWPGRVQGSVGDAEVTLQAVDAFKLLTLFEVTGVLVPLILEGIPQFFYKLTEDSGAPWAVDYGSADRILQPDTNATFGTTSDLPPIGGIVQVTSFAPAASALPGLYSSVISSAEWPTDSALTVEFWANLDLQTNGWILDGTQTASALLVCFRLRVLSRELFFYWNDGSGPYSVISSGEVVVPGSWHHYAVTRSAGGVGSKTVKFYRDGVLISSGPSAAGGVGTSAVWQLTVGGDLAGTGVGLSGKLTHLSTTPAVLDDAAIAALAAANTAEAPAGFAGAQIGVLLDGFGWPAGERSLDVGQSQIQAFAGSGSLLEILLGIAEDSERGLFQVRGDGVLVFHDRVTMRDHASQGTFGDSGAEFAYADLVLRYDDTDLYTRVTASRTGGATVSVEDTTAAATYGPRTLSLSGLALAADADVDSLARSLLARYSSPATRPVSMMLIGSAGSSNTLWAQILGRETHHDKVTLLRRPPGGGATITMGANIEGIHHSIVPAAAWQVSYDLVPDSGAWILEDDVWGLLEQTTVLAW